MKIPLPRAAACRRAAVCAAVCLSLALPATARAASPAQEPGAGANPPRVARQLRRPRGLKRLAGKAVGFLRCRSLNQMKRQELLKYGPRFPDEYDPRDFSIEALVDSNWQMSLRYIMEWDGELVVTIRVMGEKTLTHKFVGSPQGAIRDESFFLPEFKGKGRGPYPALISFKARLISTRCVGGACAPFELVAIGAGPSAVASRAPTPAPLEVASLSLPAAPVGPNARAAGMVQLFGVEFVDAQGVYVFRFSIGNDFDAWGARISTDNPKRKNYSGLETIWEVIEDEPLSKSRSPHKGDWNGIDKDGARVRPGEYRIQIAVWLSAPADASWASATDSAEGTVRIK